MRNQILSLLRKTDLREEEIQLYMCLLRKRKATLGELHICTGLSHTTTYRTIHRLIERTLIHKTPLNQKQSLYEPLSLSHLLTSLEKEQRRLRNIELSLKKLGHLVPYMDSNDYTSSSSDGVEIVEGVDALREEYLSIPEKKPEEFLAIGSSDHFWKATKASIDSPLERSFVSRRLKYNVYSRSIMVATEDAQKIARSDSQEKRTTKLKDVLPIMTNMLMISGEQVSHFVCDAEYPYVITMRHPELVALHKNNFETLWNA